MKKIIGLLCLAMCVLFLAGCPAPTLPDAPRVPTPSVPTPNVPTPYIPGL